MPIPTLVLPDSTLPGEDCTALILMRAFRETQIRCMWLWCSGTDVHTEVVWRANSLGLFVYISTFLIYELHELQFTLTLSLNSRGIEGVQILDCLDDCLDPRQSKILNASMPREWVAHPRGCRDTHQKKEIEQVL